MVFLNKKSFTVIEILITLFLISFLFGILFFVFNAPENIKRAQDGKRINDLRTIFIAINNLLVNNPNAYLGDDNVIYISLPDNNPNCSNWFSKLPPVSPPFSYKCVSQENLTKINGQGWLPIDFTQVQVGVTLNTLPIDPLNNQNNFYAYLKRGDRFKLTAKLNSQSFSYLMWQDGGIEPILYEVGNDLNIPNPQSGLVLYLPFDDGPGATTTKDFSGYGNNGRLYNFNTFGFSTTSGWTNGKIGWALAFDGVNDYVALPSGFANFSSGFSVAVWGYPTANGWWERFIDLGNGACNNNILFA
ncbi:MAG: hypothetical protein C4278_01870, partial [Patescibacteria group bacterium]